MTYSNTAANGLVITIAKSGVYSGQYLEVPNTAESFGISLNAGAYVTTDFFGLGDTLRLCGQYVGAGLAGCQSFSRKLYAGDTIRPHTQGASQSSVPALLMFSMTFEGGL